MYMYITDLQHGLTLLDTPQGHHGEGRQALCHQGYQGPTLLQHLAVSGVNGSIGDLEELEEQWRNKLQSWSPLGLNVREDGPVRLRTK